MAGAQFGENYALNAAVHFNNASVVGTYQNLAGLTLNYSRWDTIQIANTDTIDHTVSFQLTTASAPYHLATISVPAGAGAGTVALVDALATLMPSGYHYYTLTPSSFIQVTIGETINSPNAVDVTAVGGEL